MNIEEARLYLEHTSKDDFNLEEWQKENRYEAVQVILQEIERLNNYIKNLESYVIETQMYEYGDTKEEVEKYLEELKGNDK